LDSIAPDELLRRLETQLPEVVKREQELLGVRGTKADGPFPPRHFRWKGVEREFPKGIKRLYRLALAVWPQFSFRQALHIDDVNTAYERVGGSPLSIDAAENYARELSSQMTTWFPDFPAKLQREDCYVRWIDLPGITSPNASRTA
jgi:hypothetical protein